MMDVVQLLSLELSEFLKFPVDILMNLVIETMRISVNPCISLYLSILVGYTLFVVFITVYLWISSKMSHEGLLPQHHNASCRERQVVILWLDHHQSSMAISQVVAQGSDVVDEGSDSAYSG